MEKKEQYEQILQSMAATAQDALARVAPQRYTQAVVLRTAQGNEYHAVIPDALSAETEQRELIGQLTASGDTEVSQLLCMWHDGAIDLPSYDFRKLLCEADPKNMDAEIFLRTEGGYTVKQLAVTIKS